MKVGKIVDPRFEEDVALQFGVDADVRFALDEQIDELLEAGMSPQVLQSHLEGLAVSDAVELCKILVQFPTTWVFGAVQPLQTSSGQSASVSQKVADWISALVQSLTLYGALTYSGARSSSEEKVLSPVPSVDEARQTLLGLSELSKSFEDSLRGASGDFENLEGLRHIFQSLSLAAFSKWIRPSYTPSEDVEMILDAAADLRSVATITVQSRQRLRAHHSEALVQTLSELEKLASACQAMQT
jgi:hypothetical protein